MMKAAEAAAMSSVVGLAALRRENNQSTFP
jgi:hypothetical protein